MRYSTAHTTHTTAHNNTHNNNNNNLSGGRPASTREATPYGGPATTGKPGTHVALSCVGFSHSPLPALCRQDTSRLLCRDLREASGEYWKESFRIPNFRLPNEAPNL